MLNNHTPFLYIIYFLIKYSKKDNVYVEKKKEEKLYNTEEWILSLSDSFAKSIFECGKNVLFGGKMENFPNGEIKFSIWLDLKMTFNENFVKILKS
jgi:hypothetical protein